MFIKNANRMAMQEKSFACLVNEAVYKPIRVLGIPSVSAFSLDLPRHSSFLGTGATRVDGLSGPDLSGGTFMKGFIDPKYIASLECSKGEQEFSKQIPYSKVLFFLPQTLASEFTLGTIKKTILPKFNKIVQFKVVELAVLKTRPSYLCFAGDDPSKYIKVKGELLKWERKESKKPLAC